jgi:hypothetical protein
MLWVAGNGYCITQHGDFSLPLSDHQKSSILLKTSQGKTPAAIARSLGVHRATVGRFIERDGTDAKATRKRGRAGQSIAFRVAEGELEALDRLISGGLAKNRSVAFRKVLRILIGFFDPEPSYEAGLAALLSEVSAIGNNVNQATREFHKVKRQLGVAQIAPEHLDTIRCAQKQLQGVQAALTAMLQQRERSTASLISQVQEL